MADDISHSPIPEKVRLFLREEIQTYEQLEALLLLHRDRDRTWSIDAAGAELNISSAALTTALDHLCRRGLLRQMGAGSRSFFQYGPMSPNADEAVQLLARTHKGSRLEIIKLMSANAIERVRTSAIRTFADAFVRRRKQEDG
jgi:hypothetical protein